MELLVTIGYFFLIRLIFFDFHILRFNLFWKFVVFGLYICAALTEIIFLGQYTPYSKQAYVQAYTIPIAPNIGGEVQNVYVQPNTMIKKGDPLFQMNKSALQDQLKDVKSQLELQQRKYNDIAALAKKGAAPKEDVIFELDKVHSLQGKVAKIQYDIQNTLSLAPSDGYVVALALRPGTFVRLKIPLLTFINSTEQWVIAVIPQKGSQWIRPGDKAEVAFDMYPGKIFPATVDTVIWATGEAEILPGAKIPDVNKIRTSEGFVVKLRVKIDPKYPLRFGSKGIVAVYTDKALNAFVFLRQIEIRSESYLNYLYNPFG